MAPGARNKFGVPMFEPEIFRNQMHCILHWRRRLWHFWNFSAPSAVIWRPMVIRRPGNCVPLSPPSLRLWLIVKN